MDLIIQAVDVRIYLLVGVLYDACHVARLCNFRKIQDLRQTSRKNKLTIDVAQRRCEKTRGGGKEWGSLANFSSKYNKSLPQWTVRCLR